MTATILTFPKPRENRDRYPEPSVDVPVPPRFGALCDCQDMASVVCGDKSYCGRCARAVLLEHHQDGTDTASLAVELLRRAEESLNSIARKYPIDRRASLEGFCD